MVDWKLIVAGALGLGPAFILLWHSLRRYDYPHYPKTLFDDRKVFFLFAVGLVFGSISSVLWNALLIRDLFAFWMIMVVLVLFETGFMTILLNMKRFQTKFDTTFYGVSLGAGIGSTWIVWRAYYVFTAYPASISDGYYLAILLGLSIGMTGTLISAGSLVGLGSAQSRLWSGFLEGLVFRIIHGTLLIPPLFAEGEVALALVPIATAAGLLMYWYSFSSVVPETVPPEVRRERRRRVRRLKIGSKD